MSESAAADSRKRGLLPPPVQFLVLVVAVDVVFATIMRAQRVKDVLGGARDWYSLLGLLAAVYLLVVAYALARVTRDARYMRGEIHRTRGALAAHAEITHDWLWETTPEMVVTYSSRHLNDMLGYEISEVLGRDAHNFMTPATARRSRRGLELGLTGNGWHDVRSEWLHAEGHSVALLHSGVPIRNENGELVGYRGSGRVVPQEQEDAHHTAKLRARVQEIVDSAALDIALQPIIDTASGRLVSVEALARFHDGRRPDLWFEDASKVGLRAELEILAAQSALARLLELPDGISVAVNVCPEVLTDPRFVTMLADSGVPWSRLVVEITEHNRIDAYNSLDAALNTLRAGGARLAVDDTGAGYASLSHVLRLRPDIIKLDRSIVAQCDTDEARRTLITALVLLALNIGAVVTAEGVETAAELQAIADLGVDQAQGYLIARPSVELSAWPTTISA